MALSEENEAISHIFFFLSGTRRGGSTTAIINIVFLRCDGGGGCHVVLDHVVVATDIASFVTFV